MTKDKKRKRAEKIVKEFQVKRKLRLTSQDIAHITR
jgi:hypothetical protein